jgi:RND superfamily putative drug exporter
MTGPLYRIGGFAARHPLVMIAVWIVIVAGTVIGANAAGRETNDNLDLPGTGSTEATDLLERGLPKEANGSNPIVLEVKTGKLTEGKNKTAIQDTVKNLKGDKRVTEVINPLSPEGANSITKDEQIGVISVFLSISSGALDEGEAQRIFDLTEPAQKAGIDVSAGSYLGQELSVPSTESSELIGIIAAIIVLFFVFGAITAVPLPITTAIMALLTGLALIGFLGHLTDVPSIAPTLGTMLGLAVGIDYSLFIVTRHQQQLRDGMELHESIARSIATSGSAVVFAGSTVVVALLSLYFSGIPLIEALGYSTAVVVATAVLSAITLLPALLGLLGTRIEHITLPWVRRHYEQAADTPTVWTRWAGMIGRHPILAALLGIVLLLVIAIPMLHMRLGAVDYGEYPTDTTERQAYDTLTRGFGVGTNAPLLVAVDMKPPAHNDQKKLNQLNQQAAEQQAQLEQQQTEEQEAVALGEEPPPSEAEQRKQQEQIDKQQQQHDQEQQFLESTASDPRLTSLENQVSKTKDVKSVTQASVSKDGKTAVFTVIPGTSPTAEATQDLVDTLRDSVIPKALKGTQMQAYVGGQTASYIDLADRISEKLPLVIAIVVAISVALIMLAFRSILVPVIAALMNLLAVVAAYGILTAVFELGWGIELIGLDHSQPVVSYVPLMMFAILFGLSMDYQVFLLTRVREVFDSTGDAREALVVGLGRASRVVVAAATIMAVVFASFIISGNPTVKQFGVGLAASVVIDAFIVCTIMPAILLKLGGAAWWLPRWLDRALPNLGVEGEKYFEELDKRQASSAAAKSK